MNNETETKPLIVNILQCKWSDMKFTGLATTCIIAIIVAENPPRYCTNCFATFEVPKYHLHKTFHVLPNNMSTSLVLKFASYSFSLSFNFAHLVQIYSRKYFPCSFFLVCLIELLTINEFLMSIFCQQITSIFVKA